MSSKRVRQILLAIVLALAFGTTVHILTARHASTQTAALAALPGRHLQVPWWEEIGATTTSEHATYILPSDVLFATGSSVISALGRADLRSLVPKLRHATSVLVAGATDPRGGIDSAYNLALGRSRANAAVSVLVSDGLPRSLFRATSWADTVPAKHARGLDQETVYALDRRIVIIVTTATTS